MGQRAFPLLLPSTFVLKSALTRFLSPPCPNPLHLAPSLKLPLPPTKLVPRPVSLLELWSPGSTVSLVGSPRFLNSMKGLVILAFKAVMAAIKSTVPI
jgi:hypothetical protein